MTLYSSEGATLHRGSGDTFFNADATRIKPVPRLSITKLVRPMRGLSGSYLIEGVDGRHYVAKLKGNPKGTRTLINELLGSLILRRLGLPAAEGVILSLDETALRDSNWPTVGSGNSKRKAEAGFHFGSTFPGNCNKDVVYDFLPTAVNNLVANHEAVNMVLFADIWLGRTEARQAVFTRNTDRKFNLTLIDNSMLFGGSHWVFNAKPEQACYFDKGIYLGAKTINPTQAPFSGVANILCARRAEIFQLIPEEWRSEEANTLYSVLDELVDRARSLVPDKYDRGLQFGTGEILRWSAEQLKSSALTQPQEPASALSGLTRKPVQPELPGGGDSKSLARLSASSAIVAAS